jgi:predicted Zn finger-like uncharacterized protein
MWDLGENGQNESTNREMNVPPLPSPCERPEAATEWTEGVALFRTPFRARPAGPPMPIQITCGHCRASYPVDDDLRGRRVRCRECDEPLLVDGPSAAPGPEGPRLDTSEAVTSPSALPRSGAGGALLAPAAGGPFPPEEDPTAAGAGRPFRKARRTALLVGGLLLGLLGLFAGAWAWDLFDLRSRLAPAPPPAVLSWTMPERLEDLAFGGALPAKEREAGKTLLVVEVQLPRQLLGGGWGWGEWSAEFRGADLRLVTPDGQTFPPIRITALDPVGVPLPPWPPGFGNLDSWIPGSGACRTHGERPAPERFKAKAAFVVPRVSVQAGGFRVEYKGVPSAPVPPGGGPGRT